MESIKFWVSIIITFFIVGLVSVFLFHRTTSIWAKTLFEILALHSILVASMAGMKIGLALNKNINKTKED